MTLQADIFGRDYHYRTKLVNSCIMIIQHSPDEARVAAYKNFLFRMMKDIVLKNIANYTNLIRNANINLRDGIDQDELITQCYVIFERCVYKFSVNNENRHFYFYFNKALSRSFYRDYQRAFDNPDVPLTEAMETVVPSLHGQPETGELNVMMENFGFEELDIRIAKSRMLGQKTSEFLRENPDVTNGAYSRSLKKMKNVLIEMAKAGHIEHHYDIDELK